MAATSRPASLMLYFSPLHCDAISVSPISRSPVGAETRLSIYVGGID